MIVSAPPSTRDIEEAVVCATAELAVASFPRGLRAVVLTGSLARGEGTWLCDGPRFRLAGDVEFLLVFEEGAKLPRLEAAAKVAASIEARLAGGGIEAHVGLSPVRPAFLRNLQPHIFAYELVSHGRVVWGDADVLALVPLFHSADIPLEDAFRLLLNRMIELLEPLCEVPLDGPLPAIVQYRAVKLSLDMATSFLLFERKYETTYRARAERLQEIAAAPARCPIPPARFAERVTTATHSKLKHSELALSGTPSELSGLIEDARLLWRWELERLTGGGAGTHDRELLRRWMKKQPLRERVRGWASVGLRRGLRRSLAASPRWLGQARVASPRRLIYAAASELFFSLPELLYGAGSRPSGSSRWKELLRELPVPDVPAEPAARDAARRLGQAIVWHYHELLEFTRT